MKLEKDLYVIRIEGTNEQSVFRTYVFDSKEEALDYIKNSDYKDANVNWEVVSLYSYIRDYSQESYFLGQDSIF